MTRVVDGDTIHVRLGGRDERVRYIGIDTPELHPSPGQCLARQATRANRRLVAGRRVRLVKDIEARDRYGRLLAYVYVGRRLINAELVRAGYARTLTIAPNVRHAARLRELERAARAARRGLWRACR